MINRTPNLLGAKTLRASAANARRVSKLMFTALALALLACVVAGAQSRSGIGGGKPKAEAAHGASASSASSTDAAHYGTAAADTSKSSAANAAAVATAAAAPKIGETAPDFKLPYATQEKIAMKPDEQMSLSSLRGKNVIIAFYPADWSGGCTTEVCTLRDTFAELAKLNATVLAISGDYVFSHQEWAKHHNLQFPLLSDHDHHVAKMYDSYMEGVGFNKRTVYLVDKDGLVRYVNLAFKAGDKKDYDALRAELEKLK